MSINPGSYPPPSFLSIVPDQHPIAFQLPTLDSTLVPPSNDLCRKRCGADMAEHRNPKALKREPQDDPPIIPPVDPSTTPPPAFPATHHIEPAKPPPPILSEYPPFISATQPAVDFGSGITTPMASASPTFSDFHASWCDNVVPAHPLQALPVVSPSAVIPDPINAFSPTSLPPPSDAPIQIAAVPQEDVLSNPIGRMSRSNSTSHPSDSQLTYAYINQYPDNWPGVQPPASNASPEMVSTTWAASDVTVLSGSDGPSTGPSTARGTPSDDDEEESASDGMETNQSRMDLKQVCSNEIACWCLVNISKSPRWNLHPVRAPGPKFLRSIKMKLIAFSLNTLTGSAPIVRPIYPRDHADLDLLHQWMPPTQRVNLSIKL